MISDLHVAIPANDANKYSRGRLVVIAGSKRYPGAAVLAARSGQRMGAGYTQVVSSKEGVKLVRAAAPSIVATHKSNWDVGESPTSDDAHPCAICIGPGFVPGDKASDELTVNVLKHAECPVLVDGGALGGLGSSRALKCLARRADRKLATVITPHAGEAARLARPNGLQPTDPRQLAAGLSLAFRAVVVLKGPDTFISDGVRTVTMDEGGAALAKAGTGDVLAGMISALLAQGVPAFDAALTGATVHARAGNIAANQLTAVSVCPEDVIEAIPAALRTILAPM